jgi:hypothetical protein
MCEGLKQLEHYYNSREVLLTQNLAALKNDFIPNTKM